MKKGHNIFLLILSISTMFVVYFSYFYINKIINSSMDRTIEDKKIIYSENSGKSREQVLINNFNSTTLSREKLAKLYIPSDKAIVFIEALESLNEKTGNNVTISSTETDQPENNKTISLGSIRSHVDVHGSWESVMRTLKLVETLPFFVFIDRVQVSSSAVSIPNKKQKKVEWRMSFDVRAPMLISNK